MTRRWRTPKAKPGELKAQWGRVDGDSPDFVYAWGPGVEKADARLLHGIFGCKQIRLAFSEADRAKSGGLPYYFDSTALEELEERGYDLTTLKFSIRKKT